MVAKRISYGDLVKGQNLKLTIPVTGDLDHIYGFERRGRSAHEAGQRVHSSASRSRTAAIRAKVTAQETWATDVATRDAARAHGSSQNAGIDSSFPSGELDKTRFPNPQVVVKRQPRGRGGAHRVGSDSGLPAGRRQPNGRIGKGCRVKKVSSLSAEGVDWKSDPRDEERSQQGGHRTARWGGRRSSRPPISCRTGSMLLSARPWPSPIPADGTVHPHAQSEPPGAARPDGHDARDDCRKGDRATYPGAGHYGRSNGGNAGRGRRSGDPSQGSRQAGSRAVDARRGYPVVYAVAGGLLRYENRVWTHTAKLRPTRSTTTCRPCRTIGLSAPSLRACPQCPRPLIKGDSSHQR